MCSGSTSVPSAVGEQTGDQGCVEASWGWTVGESGSVYDTVNTALLPGRWVNMAMVSTCGRSAGPEA